MSIKKDMAELLETKGDSVGQIAMLYNAACKAFDAKQERAAIGHLDKLEALLRKLSGKKIEDMHGAAKVFFNDL